MPRQFVIGDIHGAYPALIQCFERSKFDLQHDTLICLGDVVDRWPDAPACIEVLMKIQNLVFVLGNHDKWALDWAVTGIPEPDWFAQGGKETIAVFGGKMKKKYINFFNKAKLFYILDNRLFVHAGFNLGVPFEQNKEFDFLWDRSLFKKAFEYRNQKFAQSLSPFSEVYIGHTPLVRFDISYPINGAEVWMMDTGAGWNGPLSMMDIDTKEVFQSDVVTELYS
jgi:serine/threonine protein phosphatase 1